MLLYARAEAPVGLAVTFAARPWRWPTEHPVRVPHPRERLTSRRRGLHPSESARRREFEPRGGTTTPVLLKAGNDQFAGSDPPERSQATSEVAADLTLALPRLSEHRASPVVQPDEARVVSSAESRLGSGLGPSLECATRGTTTRS